MSWEVIGDSEPLGQFATNSGYADLAASAEKTDFSALKDLFSSGETARVEECATQLRQLSGPDGVTETARQFAELIDGQKAVTITDGSDEEPEGEGVSKVGSEGVEFGGVVAKVDTDKHLVFGWFSVVEVAGKPVVDTQGDLITSSTIEDSAYDFVLHARKAGEMHRTEKGDEVAGIGRLVESVVFTKEKQRAMLDSLKEQGIDAALELNCVAWWGGFKVDDPDTWKKVVGGELKAFSIGGSGKREKIDAI